MHHFKDKKLGVWLCHQIPTSSLNKFKINYEVMGQSGVNKDYSQRGEIALSPDQG